MTQAEWNGPMSQESRPLSSAVCGQDIVLKAQGLGPHLPQKATPASEAPRARRRGTECTLCQAPQKLS